MAQCFLVRKTVQLSFSLSLSLSFIFTFSLSPSSSLFLTLTLSVDWWNPDTGIPFKRKRRPHSRRRLIKTPVWSKTPHHSLHSHQQGEFWLKSDLNCTTLLRSDKQWMGVTVWIVWNGSRFVRRDQELLWCGSKGIIGIEGSAFVIECSRRDQDL